LAYAANMWNEALNKRRGTKVKDWKMGRLDMGSNRFG
ncbi:hypothetical protein Tco_1022563, partial [Tanacetum coccineum]